MTFETWYEMLDQLIGREGLSRPQVARRSGVKTKTITSWLRGDVQRPHQWQPLVCVLRALGASTSEADRILQGAGHRTVREIARRATGTDLNLLADWFHSDVPFMAPDRPVSTLIGRTQELEKMRQALRHEKRCAIWGMGGVGKTILAIELAHELKDTFRDGVFWGDMRVSSADAVLESWGQACNVDMRRLTDLHSRAARMRGAFSQKQALLILDDVVDSRQALQMVPSQLSDCVVLITSRFEDVAQGMTGRRQVQIVPLLPLPRHHSFALFADVSGKDTLEIETQAADRVADLLGDLPLALQICAALCANSDLTLNNMATLLADLRTRLDHLQIEQEPVVRLAFEQSWHLLNENMRQAFATLAVFEGRPFTTSTFAACAQLDEDQSTFMLTQLCRRSLLSAVHTERYQQHTLLAAFAIEKLADNVNPWRRLSTYFHDYVQRCLHHNTPLQDEWSNIMAGMRIAHWLKDWSLVLDYFRLLQNTWQQQGLYSFARIGCAWALEAADVAGDKQIGAEILLHWGVACLEQADSEPARTYLEQALERFEGLGAYGQIGDVHYHLSRIELEQDNFSLAETIVQKAWQYYQQEEDVRGMGRALYRLGNIFYHRGIYQRAIELANEALQWQIDSGDHIGRLRSHMLTASAHLQLGQIEQADHHCQQAAQLNEQLNDRAETSVFYYTYADLCRFQSEFPLARDYAQKALAIFREMYDTFSEANALNLLAAIEIYWNDADPQRQIYAEGLGYCQQGVALCDLLDYSVGKAFLLLAKGRLLAQQGALEEACEAWKSAQKLSHALQHPWLETRLEHLLQEGNCNS